MRLLIENIFITTQALATLQATGVAAPSSSAAAGGAGAAGAAMEVDGSAAAAAGSAEGGLGAAVVDKLTKTAKELAKVCVCVRR